MFCNTCKKVDTLFTKKDINTIMLISSEDIQLHVAHNQNSALAHQNSENMPSKQRKGYIATCKDVLIEIVQINYP